MKRKRRTGLRGAVVRWLLFAVLGFYGLAALSLAALRWIDPPTTSVQIERRVQSWFARPPYTKRYRFLPLDRISRHLQRAVITADDARFFEHHGFDWKEIREAVEDEIEDGHLRGASTITQQLVKNLFLTTSRSVIRKALEATLVPLAEGILPKRRILELYLNVVEWGPGVYGADAAARYHYKAAADRLTREQAARLAAILPSPLRRKPARMDQAAGRILARMAQAGW